MCALAADFATKSRGEVMGVSLPMPSQRWQIRTWHQAPTGHSPFAEGLVSAQEDRPVTIWSAEHVCTPTAVHADSMRHLDKSRQSYQPTGNRPQRKLFSALPWCRGTWRYVPGQGITPAGRTGRVPARTNQHLSALLSTKPSCVVMGACLGHSRSCGWVRTHPELEEGRPQRRKEL
jgi:hypothetical protein